MISIEELKEKMSQLGYYITDSFAYEAWIALYMFGNDEIHPGQDIFAICLEGPPGAGKTFFAETYAKVAHLIYNTPVEIVEYQCDATTGKEELFEDINISAAISGNAEKVNVPGKLIEAIKLVNDGKKVVLFIDEYDKAREETDAFLLQFLQSGKINATQHGDQYIKEEYKGNLQVILCKNDMREELSGPLSRRIRISRLDYMKPDIFLKVANKILIENKKVPVKGELINLVVLMYQKLYDNKDLYSRIPACSEMLIALEDADKLLCLANAPKYIVYNNIIKNMLKNKDDINTFTNSLVNDTQLGAVIKEITNIENNEKSVDINSLIVEKIATDESSKLFEKARKMDDLIKQTKEKLKVLESKQIENNGLNKILLSDGKLVSTNKVPNVVSNFDDSTDYVKRGFNVFDLSKTDWTEIATINLTNTNQKQHLILIKYLIKVAEEYELVIYENGILLNPNDNIKLAAILCSSEYKIISSSKIIPSSYLNNVLGFVKIISDYMSMKNLKTNVYGNYKISTLVYDTSTLSYEQEIDNVYNVQEYGNISATEDYESVFNFTYNDEESAISASNKLVKKKVK